jgi:hypothetical protein
MFVKPPCNEEIFFDNGTRRIVDNIKSIRQGTWWHLFTDDAEIIINPNRVLFVKVLKIK